MEELLNASQAHRKLILAGFDISYEKARKLLEEHGIAQQPMKGGTVVVKLEDLKKMITKLKKNTD
jgi:ABC-type transport system substrate-binding protein